MSLLVREWDSWNVKQEEKKLSPLASVLAVTSSLYYVTHILHNW